MKNKTLDNFKNIPKKTNKGVGGTSFHGTTVKTTARNLISIFGDSTGSCSKTAYNWDCETSDGKVFTVYDWKEIKKIELDDIIEYHIGGFNKQDTEKAKKEIERILHAADSIT